MPPDREVTQQSQYLEKVVKLIPAEVVAAYVSIQGILLTQDASTYQPWLLGIAVGLGLVVLPVYLWKLHGVRNWIQIGVTIVAFAIWVLNIGGNYLQWVTDWNNPAIGSVALILFTLVSPLIFRSEA